MKHSERFTKAIDALVKAYLNETLAKGHCAACAVGNIVAHSLGSKVIAVDPNTDEVDYYWEGRTQGWYATTRDVRIGFLPGGYGLSQIAATGYSIQEIIRIEDAFEGATDIQHCFYGGCTPEEIDADQYAGLCAVVDVLCQIEGIADATEYKALFSKSVPA